MPSDSKYWSARSWDLFYERLAIASEGGEITRPMFQAALEHARNNMDWEREFKKQLELRMK